MGTISSKPDSLHRMTHFSLFLAGVVKQKARKVLANRQRKNHHQSMKFLCPISPQENWGWLRPQIRMVGMQLTRKTKETKLDI